MLVHYLQVVDLVPPSIVDSYYVLPKYVFCLTYSDEFYTITFIYYVLWLVTYDLLLWNVLWQVNSLTIVL